MRRAGLVSWLLVVTILSGCSSAPRRDPGVLDPLPEEESAWVLTNDPCQDLRFLALQTRPIDEMSDAERHYYLEMSRLCLEAQRTRSQVQMERAIKRGTDATMFFVFLAAAAGLIWYVVDQSEEE